jgi:hypothetical protein
MKHDFGPLNIVLNAFPILAPATTVTCDIILNIWFSIPYMPSEFLKIICNSSHNMKTHFPMTRKIEMNKNLSLGQSSFLY